MNKLILLNLGKGNLLSGFPSVTVQLQEEGNPNWRQFQGSLPASPDIIELYRRWKLLYELLYEVRSINISLRQLMSDNEDIKIDESDVTHVSDAEFYEVCEELQKKLDLWLDFGEFRSIDRQIRKQLVSSDEIRIIIQTEDNYLRKLPWHLWQFFRDYPQAEVGLSALEFEPGNQSENSTRQVRILAILGDRTGIDIEADRKLLETLPDTQIVFLVEPHRSELDDWLWDSQGWDILFFAGHSLSHSSGDSGKLYINPTESLTIFQLRNALNQAIKRRLRLAIFNSCDGLGLSRELADLHIPQTIVMREPVPDKVAQEFLKNFLAAFSGGQSFYTAVREARERLQGIESNFPGASWLPIICQNPAEVPPTWQQLRGLNFANHVAANTFIKTEENQRSWFRFFKTKRGRLLAAVFASTVISLALTFLRAQGVWQAIELQAFDFLMRQQPIEKTDRRLLVVVATEADLSRLNEPILSDGTVARVIERLKQYHPKVIGLDIYRDLPVGNTEGRAALIKQMQQKDAPIAICTLRQSGELEKAGQIPPEGFAESSLSFNSVPKDLDGTIRRHLLQSDPDISSPCQAKYAFSLQLALSYLQKTKNIVPKSSQKNFLQLGEVEFTPIESYAGGYQKLDPESDLGGYQVLLNYRPYRVPENIAQTVNVSHILNEKNPLSSVKDRIVLIGYADGDFIKTPFTAGQHPPQELPGVFLHAQMVSQILSAVLDKRPLLWWLPWWGDALWIWGWSLVGAILIWRVQLPSYAGVAGTILLFILYELCLAFLKQGGWMPLIPATLALTLTIIATGGFYRALQKRC